MIADARILRKLGLGPRPEDDLGRSLDSWIDLQLDAPPVRLGVARARDPSPKIENWPESLSFSLEERIARLVEMRRQSDELNEMKLPEFERARRENELELKYLVVDADQHKFAHANVYSADHVNIRLAEF